MYIIVHTYINTRIRPDHKKRNLDIQFKVTSLDLKLYLHIVAEVYS